jgi:S1-C subfamily serine protease
MRKLSTYGPSLIVLLTAIVVLFAGPGVVKMLTYAQTQARIIQASERLSERSILDELNQAYRDIAMFVEPSVVHISAERMEQDRWGQWRLTASSGSGWLYDDQGHVVTNLHVVQNAQRIQVQLHTGELREAELTGFDQFTDIALIRIPPGRIHPATRASAADGVSQGDMVFAFGSPFDFRFSMSAGVVSGMGRSVGVIRDQFGRRIGYENFIQVDAAINPGNSGGPLTDIHGRVIGMNTAIATGGRQSELDEGQFGGIGLAIPIDMIEPVASQLIATGTVTKGYLGVTANDIPDDHLRTLVRQGFSGQGVIVIAVDEDGPARQAGLRSEDVITHVDGQSISRMSQLRSVISSKLPGESAELRIWRFDHETARGGEQVLQVTLSRLDTGRLAGGAPGRDGTTTITIPALGLTDLRTLRAMDARRMGLDLSGGVLIGRVEPDSPLRGELVAGSVITSIMDQEISTVEELQAMLNRGELERGVRAAVTLPDGTRTTVLLRLGG